MRTRTRTRIHRKETPEGESRAPKPGGLLQAPKKEKIVHLYRVSTINGSGMQKMMLCIYVHKHPQTHKHPAYV